jgi:protein transport protein SEC24
MYSAPPGGGMHNGGGGAPPSPGLYSQPQGNVRPSPTHYAQMAGGGGDVDQPLAEKFCALQVSGGPTGQNASFAPEALPRPTAEELDSPLRLDTREAVMEGPDLGQCHPKFMRMTVNAIPSTAAHKTKACLPIGAIIQPMARVGNADVPVVNFGSTGVVRCRRCRTYINPFVGFLDGGRRWRCNVCSLVNDVPNEYFCELDADGMRRDRLERPELHLGTVEFVAPQEYMVRPPQPPVYLFVVEVSYTAVSSGMLRCAAATLLHTLDRLPGGERTQIGLITYDSTLQFYNLAASSPTMLNVSEVDEVFLPLPEDLLANVHERKEQLVALFEKLATMHQDNQGVEVALGPALKAGYQLIQHIGGKMHVFNATRPSVGEAKLRNREGDQKRDAKGPSLLQPDVDFYKTMAVDCTKQQVSIDLWNFSGAYADLATLGQLVKHTTGHVHWYPGFSDAVMGEKFSRDLQWSLTRDQGWEAVMRVRASRGMRISAFHGHFFIRGTDLLALPNIDEDTSFAVEIGHEESEATSPACCLQAALLYTTSGGERRIRVHTMQVPITNALTTLFEAADVDACANLMARIAAEQALNSRLLDGAEKLQHSCMELMRAYRSLCPPQAKGTNQMLLPESLKLLPLYVLGLMKSSVFTPAPEVRADEHSAVLFALANMSASMSTALIHPRLFQVFPPAAAIGALPAPLPLTAQGLLSTGAYLVDCGSELTLWIGRGVPTDFVQQVGPAGTPHTTPCPPLPTLANPCSPLQPLAAPCSPLQPLAAPCSPVYPSSHPTTPKASPPPLTLHPLPHRSSAGRHSTVSTPPSCAACLPTRRRSPATWWAWSRRCVPTAPGAGRGSRCSSRARVTPASSRCSSRTRPSR